MSLEDTQLLPAQEEETAATCVLCQSDSARAEGRTRNGKFSCRHCETLATLVRRNVGPKPFQEYTDEQKVAFFRKLKPDSESARYSWPTVRAALVERAVASKVSTQAQALFTEGKPESVWLAAGYSSTALANCPRFECPVLGTVIKVPVHQETLTELRQQAEEQVLQKEKNLCQKKKRKVKDGEANNGEAEEDELDVPATRGGSGPGRTGPAAKEDSMAAAGALQREAKKATTFNEKQKTLASKAVASLNGSAKAMAAAQAGLEKKNVASELAASLAEARKKVAVDQRASCWNARERPAL